MADDLFFNITPRDAGVKYVLFGREMDGFRIYTRDRDDEPIWRYDQVQDHLDHILPDLAELIDSGSTWQNSDTGELITAWDALVLLSGPNS